jgi:hypothetical protein
LERGRLSQLGAAQAPDLRGSRFFFCQGLGSFQNLILECDALRVVLLEPCLSSVRIREYLDVVLVADLLARVDVHKDGHWSLLSFLRPQ